MDKELSPNTTLAHYRIVSKIGAGGMGEVYLAQDTKLDRKVALKILPAEVASNRERMGRFVREAKSAAALNHPNIATIHEIGESAGVNFIAMEFIDGATLREKIHREQTEPRKLMRYLQQVAEGLAKAHAAGIVHRDLKPDNVMITRDGYAKILDFGLAKLIQARGETETGGEEDPTIARSPRLPVSPSASTPGVIMGTVGYMSPEQAQGKAVDHRSDIFSFGCILYEAATGQRAFQSESTIDTLHKIVHSPVPLVKDANPSAPADLTRIVRRCMAKDPDERYQSIREAAIELRDVRGELEGAGELQTTVPPSSVGSTVLSTKGDAATTSGAPASTSPTSSAEYIVSGIKRHKIAAVAMLALVLGGIALTAYLRAFDTEVAIDSIAVLPFVNQNRDSDSEYLSDGLTESIINSLTQLPGLRVSPRSSVFQYKGKDTDPMKAARDLGVRAVVTGRLLQRGDNLTISTELLDVRDNKQVWGEQYNRKLADALAVQQEISREITDRLRLKVSSEEQKQLTRRDASNPEAYQLYLKGRYYWNKRTAENIKRAMEQFQRATDLDPKYGLAYVGLADCYLVLEEYAGTPASETIPKAKAFAQRALELDGSLAGAHTSLAYALHHSWRWDEAETEFKQALKLDPNYATAHHWYSLYLRDVGRFEEAETQIKRAHELDPVSHIIAVNLAQVYLLKGDVNSSIEESRKIIDLDPNHPRGHGQLGLGYLKQGRHSEAIAEFKKAIELSASDRGSFRNLGYGYARSGKRSEALNFLKEVQGKYDRHEAVGADVAAVYVGLGDIDQAFVWLEKDFQVRSGRLARIIWEPYFEPLRSDPRYADLRRRMGLKT